MMSDVLRTLTDTRTPLYHSFIPFPSYCLLSVDGYDGYGIRVTNKTVVLELKEATDIRRRNGHRKKTQPESRHHRNVSSCYVSYEATEERGRSKHAETGDCAVSPIFCTALAVRNG